MALARKIETGQRLSHVDGDDDGNDDDEVGGGANKAPAAAGTIVMRIARQGTVVGHSKLLEAMKQKKEQRRISMAPTRKVLSRARRLHALRHVAEHDVSVSA